jgi:glycosyltransferase involved in cell wall biosynthesis
MPVHNAERFLREAVESVLSQTFPDFEFIIVNDGSTDAGPAILDEYRKSDERICVYHQDRQGIVAALNLGLSRCRGKYIARMDADDVAMPQRLETQVKLMDEHPELVILGSAVKVIDEGGRELRVYRPPATDTEIRWRLLFDNAFPHPAVLLNGRVLRERRLEYDEKARHAEDYDLWSRLLEYGLGRNAEVVLMSLRLHGGQVSRAAAVEQNEAAFSISRANLARLGCALSAQEVRRLRDLHVKLPERLSESDMSVCLELFRILRLFETRPGMDRETMMEIRRRFIGQIVRSLSPRETPHLLTSGLLAALAREGLPSMASSIRVRLRRWRHSVIP